MNRDLIYLIMTRIIQVLVSIISIKIITSLFDPKELGKYYIILTLITLVSFIFLNPLGQYFNRHIIGWREKNNLKNATIVLLILRFLCIIVSIVLAVIIFYIFDYNQYFSLGLFIGIISLLLISQTYQILLGAVNILGDRLYFMKYMTLISVIGLIMGYSLVSFYNHSSITWLIGISIAESMFLYMIFKHLVKSNSIVFSSILNILNINYIRKVFLFILPVAITLLLQWSLSLSYRFIIENKYSIEVLAYIAVGLSVSAAIFSAVEGLVMQYFNPIYLKSITNKTMEERRVAWNNLANSILPIYIMIAIFSICLSQVFVSILLDEKYHNVYLYTMIGIFIELVRVSTNILYLVSQSELKTKTTIVPYFIGVSITVILLSSIDLSISYILIPCILLLSSIVVYILLFRNMKKLLPISIEISKLVQSIFYSLPFLFFATITNIYASIIISSLYLLGLIYLFLKRQSHINMLK